MGRADIFISGSSPGPYQFPQVTFASSYLSVAVLSVIKPEYSRTYGAFVVASNTAIAHTLPNRVGTDVCADDTVKSKIKTAAIRVRDES